EPTVLVREQLLLERDGLPVCRENDAVQMGAAKRREDERSAQGSRTREERRAARRPGLDRSALEQRVAVPGVVREPANVRRAGVLGVRPVLRIAGGDIELAVRAKPKPPTVVGVVAGNTVEEHGLFNAAATLIAHAHDLVARAAAEGIAVVEVDQTVLREARIERDPEKALLGAQALRDGEGRPGLCAQAATLAELDDPYSSWPFRHEEPAIGRKIHGPRRREPRGDRLDVLDDGRAKARA